MKKRILSALMVGAMCTGLLSGCGGGKAASTGDSSAADNAATATDDNTLTVWCWDPAFNINAMKEAEKVYQIIRTLS